jgi:hypothetical protein
MHWILWTFIACLLFLVTYKPRTGRLNKFFTSEILVEDNGQRTAQSDSDSSVPRE